MEAPDPVASGIASEDEAVRRKFSDGVKRMFDTLTEAHMEVNQACALALKIAAGMAEPPISVAVVMQSLQTAIKARQTRGAAAASSRTAELASLQDAAAKVYRLFSSPDSLHAAFWHDSSAQASQGGPKQPPIVVDLTLEDDDSSSSQLRAGLSQQGVNSGRPVAASPAGEAESGVTQTEQGVSATSQQGSQQQSEQVATGSTASQGQGQIAQRQPSTQGAGGEPSRDLSGRLMSGDSVRIVSGDSNVQVGDATAADAPEASSDSSVQVVSSRDGSQDSDDVITTAETDACMAVSMLDTVDTVRQTVATADVEATTREMEQQGISLPAIMRLYAAIATLRSQRVITSLVSASERLLMTVTSLPAPANPGWQRQLLVLLFNPLLEDLEHSGLLTNIASAMVALSGEQRATFVKLLSALPTVHLKRLVITLQQYITITLYEQQAITPGIEMATKALGLLYDANLAVCDRRRASRVTAGGAAGPALLAPQEPLPFSEFYNDAVNNDDFNLKEDFRRWKSLYRSEFSFCSYPYVYDPASKARVLQMECQLTQYNELHSALFRGLFGSSGQADLCPFLVLKVRRGAHLVQDTLVQVHSAKAQGALRKPLKVKFVGEEGVDEGGVQKEFFQLLIRELFNPDYGMFTHDDKLRLHWFRPSHIDMDTEFELVGILVGLAIYNSHILEFSFPLVLYKLLVGCTPTLDDLKELHPDIHASLVKLLAMSETDLEACELTFSVDVEYALGTVETVELVPGQGSLPVTTANVHLYVEHYVEHLLVRSVQRQFSAFRQGFLRLCAGAALDWFRPEELELLVCGGRTLDLSALESATLYDDGYCKDSTVVRWFWDVVHSLNPDKQKKLLAFVTGSDRVPIKGLSALNPPFVISRMGGDPDRLPTAHTCFNHLLLPSYSSREALHQRLEMALENAEGFGLM